MSGTELLWSRRTAATLPPRISRHYRAGEPDPVSVAQEPRPAPVVHPPLQGLRAICGAVRLALPGPRALNGPTEMVRYEDAAGRIAAEMIAPAPPRVPRLVPGQRISAEHVA
ncbi:hypothetical protein [Sphingomonas sp. BK345]|uniref:Orn/Lys/Arg family decarboxylase n=1 Tax=Sphingomonas sp. BK345 TaxID=2586980 RepID=UPI002889AE5A|nr:hypothetical protein [Sphingomonas sp. BK345]